MRLALGYKGSVTYICCAKAKERPSSSSSIFAFLKRNHLCVVTAAGASAAACPYGRGGMRREEKKKKSSSSSNNSDVNGYFIIDYSQSTHTVSVPVCCARGSFITPSSRRRQRSHCVGCCRVNLYK